MQRRWDHRWSQSPELARSEAVSAGEGGVGTHRTLDFVAVGCKKQTVEGMGPVLPCLTVRAVMGPAEALLAHSLEVVDPE